MLDVELPGLPEELDGLRIAHLSDFHFGVPSPGVGAAWQAAVWTWERRPDLVAITGDLLTHPRGEPMLRRLVRVLPRPTVAVLGNHDLAISRDPQARASNLRELEPGRFDLVLAGHMHDGQIALPFPGGKVRFAHPRAPFNAGVYRNAAATMHVSSGLGTTFVPFRFAARPEATELVLRAS